MGVPQFRPTAAETSRVEWDDIWGRHWSQPVRIALVDVCGPLGSSLRTPTCCAPELLVAGVLLVCCHHTTLHYLPSPPPPRESDLLLPLHAKCPRHGHSAARSIPTSSARPSAQVPPIPPPVRNFMMTTTFELLNPTTGARMERWFSDAPVDVHVMMKVRTHNGQQECGRRRRLEGGVCCCLTPVSCTYLLPPGDTFQLKSKFNVTSINRNERMSCLCALR